MTDAAAEKRRISDHYPHESAVVRRVLRRYGRLTQDDFDRVFGMNDLSARANSLGYFLLRGDTPMLGMSLGGPLGNWNQWLDLLQRMITDGEAKTGLEGSRVVYSLVEPD